MLCTIQLLCASCGTKPKAGNRFDGHSPDADHVSRLLQTTDTEVDFFYNMLQLLQNPSQHFEVC